MNHILWSPDPGIVIGNSGLQMHRELNETTKKLFHKFIENISCCILSLFQ